MKPDELDELKDHFVNNAPFYAFWAIWTSLTAYIGLFCVTGMGWAEIIAPICAAPGVLTATNKGIVWLRSGTERKALKQAQYNKKIKELEAILDS